MFGPYWHPVYITHREFRRLFSWEFYGEGRVKLVSTPEFQEWLNENSVGVHTLKVREEQPGDPTDPTWDRAINALWNKTHRLHLPERKVRFMHFANPKSAVLFSLRWTNL